MTVIPVSCVCRGQINITFILETSSQVRSAESIRRGINYENKHTCTDIKHTFLTRVPWLLRLIKKANMLVSSINPSERLKERTVIHTYTTLRLPSHWAGDSETTNKGWAQAAGQGEVWPTYWHRDVTDPKADGSDKTKQRSQISNWWS